MSKKQYKRNSKSQKAGQVWHIFFATFFIMFSSLQLFAELDDKEKSSEYENLTLEEKFEKAWKEASEAYVGSNSVDCAKIHMKNSLLSDDLKKSFGVADEECPQPGTKPASSKAKTSAPIGLFDDTKALPRNEIVHVDTPGNK